MQNMISKIIEMDEAARQLIAKAEEEKIKCEADIANSEEEIKKSYIKHAKKRIKDFEQKERISAQKAWEITSQNNKKRSSELDSIYKDNFDKWVDTLVKMVIGG